MPKPLPDFELALNELIDKYRHRIPRQQAISALQSQCNVVGDDDQWTDEKVRRDDDDDDDDDDLSDEELAKQAAEAYLKKD